MSAYASSRTQIVIRGCVGLAAGALFALSFGLIGPSIGHKGETSNAEPGRQNVVVALRRLTPEQYRLLIADVFGPTVNIDGRFEPDARADGLLAVGASQVSVTETGLERYDSLARNIATQVVDTKHRDMFIPCKPVSEASADDGCASRFFSEVAPLLYRRAPHPDETARLAAAARRATDITKDFYSGIALSLASLLESPEFLFREEVAEPDPDHAGQYRLTSVSKASRLSFLLWNSAPDERLLAAAESGELNSNRGLSRQVDRMLASRRVEDGTRAFFIDMLQFDEFATLSKDATIFPKFTPLVVHDSEEQTLRTIVDHLLTRHGDYRDLFTTRRTFLTLSLAAIYNVPLADDSPNGARESWISYEYPVNDPRGVGILSQASFVALHSQPGRSSPTLRGKALRQVLLCQRIPDPPANVNFSVVQDTSNPHYRTARERVTAHRTNPTCAGCHKMMDPIGLALENFDSTGGYRRMENGATIDASGELDGVSFANAVGLGRAVHDSPSIPECLVTRLYSYATGRERSTSDARITTYLERSFKSDGYRWPELLRRLATSDDFYRVPPRQVAALPASHQVSQLLPARGGDQ
jgi:hypothetical protein